MAYREIEIPGGGTRYEGQPRVEITGGGNEHVTLRVIYHSAALEENQPERFGQITFRKVLEYRFIDEMTAYEEYDRHFDDGELGLVEITDSQYVETMLARSLKADGPAGHRIAEHIPDTSIHHYRLAFDDYGRFDVIAFAVELSEIVGK